MRFWKYDYDVEFESEIGYSNGPKGNAVIDSGRVYTCGVTARLHCFDLKSGKLLWEIDLMEKYNIPQYFFGYGTIPIVSGDRIMVNVGGREPDNEAGGVCVAAFDKLTGKELWTVRDEEWGASYASPIMAKLHGKDCLLVFAGGKSDPATGGLLTIDPANGKLLDRFPWRAEMVFSANASTPLVVGDNRVFLSECYRIGAVVLEFDENFKSKVLWTQRRFGLHWMQPILKDGYLYGFAGRNEPDVELACCEVATGEIKWRKDLRWTERDATGSDKIRSFFRGTLLEVDGSTLCLGEHGALAWMKFTPEGVTVEKREQLFVAPETWSLPVVYRGLLYVTQNDPDRGGGTSKPRWICYDFRAAE